MVNNSLPNVLVVDDEPLMRTFLKRALEPMAGKVAEASNATGALEAIQNSDYDIILSDISMPDASGLDLLAMAKQSQWDVGFILITGRVLVEQVIDALRLQASDFLLKPFTIEALTEAVLRTYQRLLSQREARAYRGWLESSVNRHTRDLETALRQVELNYQTTLEALVAALDAREHETYAHSFRVRAYTIRLAHQIGYPPLLMRPLEHAALLHDIGKIAVSDGILLKPGRLTQEEWMEMKKHVVVGEQILNRIPFLKPAAIIVRHHHERFDSTGYPDGRAGENIPLGARLFAFADTLDAMTSDRPYRKAPGFALAHEEFRRCSGTQFDPRIVEHFLQVPEETWMEIRAEAERRNSD